MNSTVSVPWVERASASRPSLSKSFRMIKSYSGEEEDNICPDQSRCPAEFSCLRALTKYSCCPLAQGVPCTDGKHCCPEGHQCSLDSRSCIKKDLVTTVLCGDGKQECPDGTTCCETSEGVWGCCLLPKAVCCADKIHCCPDGNTCDIQNFKCVSLSTSKVTPMWAKFPARVRAEWENQKEGERVTAEAEKAPEVTTEDTVPPTGKEVSLFTVPAGNDVPCDDTSACPDGTTCCKNEQGGWACCPLSEAVCCSDLIHCCPKGKTCNLAAGTCDDETCSLPLLKKLPTIPWKGALVENVPCDSSHACPDETTCCKTETGEWACCPFPQAVCCEDHQHCCPSGTTCDLASSSCVKDSGSTPMQLKTPALTTLTSTTMKVSPQITAVTTGQQTTAEEEKKPEEGVVQCDAHTACPESTTCCFMKSSQRWGCCPLPQAVCCSNGVNCCPKNYKCDKKQTACIKGEVVIPWYTKLPAITSAAANPRSVMCDGQTQCPDHTTCCQLPSGDWGCCPLEHAVCCQDKMHCCPQGYTCDVASNSCQKVIMLQLETLPLIPVFLAQLRTDQPQLPPLEQKNVKCDDKTSCEDGQTCCRMSASTWGCCPLPNAVCCSDMQHCCPAGHTCTPGGDCEAPQPPLWKDWQMFEAQKRRALIV